MRRGALIIPVLALGAACSTHHPAHVAQITVSGSVKVQDTAMMLHHCNPRWASSLDTAVPGSTVTVYDSTGKIVGTTTLGQGVVYTAPGQPLFESVCAYDYRVTVPDSGFYQVQVGDGGTKVTFTKAAAQGHADIEVTNVNAG